MGVPRPKAARSRRPATTEPEVFTPAAILVLPDLANADPETEGFDPDAEPEPEDELEAESEVGPSRRCIVTRERRAKEKMIRFVLGPDRTIVPDLAARLPGRGIWLSARWDVLETARVQGSLVRAFAKQVSKEAAKNAAAGDVLADAGRASAKAAAKAGRNSVTLPSDLSDRIEAMLVRRIVELLGLARRAGQTVCGFQKAREWLTANRVGLVVQASDGSVDERARFLSGARALDLNADEDIGAADSVDAEADEDLPREAVPRGIPVGSPLPAAALGAVFGRDHVVHVVVAPGRLAVALTNEIARLSGLTRRLEPDCVGSDHAEPGRAESRRAESGRKNAKAGPKAAGGNAGKMEAGQTGQDHDVNKRADV